MNDYQPQDLLSQLAPLSGTLRSEDAINQRLLQLDQLDQIVILLSPSTTCTLQPGCSVTFTLVKLDAERESHPVRRDDSGPDTPRSLYGTALYKLADAAGLAWNGARSYRVDDGSDQHYVHWHVECAMRALDGTVRPYDDDCHLDLREGSDQLRNILEAAKNDADGERQLRATRAKILERAQTGAQLRCIRKALHLGKYTFRELDEKAFMIVTVAYDGHDDDPEIERDNKRAIRDHLLSGSRALFGAPPSLAEPARLARGAPPPPLGAVDAEGGAEDDFPPEYNEPPRAGSSGAQRAAPTRPPPPAQQRVSPRWQRAAPTRDPHATPRSQPAAPARPAPPPKAETRPQVATKGATRGFQIPGTRQPIEEANDEQLNFWANKLDYNLRNNKCYRPEEDRRLLDAILHVIDQRVGAPAY